VAEPIIELGATVYGNGGRSRVCSADSLDQFCFRWHPTILTKQTEFLCELSVSDILRAVGSADSPPEIRLAKPLLPRYA